MSFNEVSFGFVPHAGASYYLSRLPNEVGTFLALTGLPLVGIDAMEYNLVDELIHLTKGYEEEIQDIVRALE
jgi:enoyl-CoA hydratase/carnithine racemase